MYYLLFDNLFSSCLRKVDLSENEYKALKELQFDTSIAISQADKDRASVIVKC